ncbi:hypothetical protein GGD81_000759 [Rhodobium orientis]|uniref:Cyclophilin TM1367-like domain-containing protein n=1 Tax=Rhodobium orientis TaxID=34017 RepID=A0A327JP23_9HYPH|nr:cyclophilin-like fold protein [Rhodobium orientis]MBB4301742.1 hypothetical protein [Rhodobium orientis]MBK5950545.1 hypothetical protein [Rhodobium orientis]RAI28189.1 hypothetical protein CH339_07535 [Rhodobium orientis]
MSRKIVFEFPGVTLTATLRDTPMADAVWAMLPEDAPVLTWGDEVYFSMPTDADLEPDAKEVVEAGEIAFWPEGRIIAIGFGPTPLSLEDEIRLAAPVNVFADADGDVRDLATVVAGDRVVVRRAD